MDEEIKRIFCKHFDMIAKHFENASGGVKRAYSYAMVEITDLYADICGISYDAAANELQNADEKSRR